MNKMLKQSINLPSPINISYLWNFGSILGLFLIIQITSGLIISMHYCPNINYAFTSLILITQNINFGWLYHNIHMNGASFFFLFLFLHLSRNLYYLSFKLTKTWYSGISIFIISMITAFLGYILPWGQMSFWGATVITNLISTIPYMGISITQWIWGGFSINNSTLNRFFSLHFIMPFLIMILIIIHLFFLHETGSKNPLGTNSNLHKIPFNYYYSIKDIYLYTWILLMFFFLNLTSPYILSDTQNFIPANPMITPSHIQPEWYFLFAYTILRSIPNKLGGVIALIMSILIFYLLPLLNNWLHLNTSLYYFPNQISFWLFINIFIILTFLGSQPIEYPFSNLSQIMSLLYFLYFFFFFILINLWELIILNLKI